VSTQPRLAPTTEADWDDETRTLIERSGGLNIFTTVAHHPKALKRWLVFGAHVMAKSTLSDRARELVVLRVGWRCGSDYEFGQHTLIGRSVGLTDEEIARVTVPSLDGWDDDDARWLRAADELVEDHRLSDGTWEELSADLDPRQLIDLVMTAGQYVMVSTLLNTFGVQREEGVPGWPV
jgi:alkylhydroperoxidase family enzyme